jgi:hypothetical protein
VLTTKDGQLLSQREVLKSQLRTQPEGDRNQTQQSQNRRGHGCEVSRPMTRNVNTINMAGVLANHKSCGLAEGEVMGRRLTGPSSRPGFAGGSDAPRAPVTRTPSGAYNLMAFNKE